MSYQIRVTAAADPPVTLAEAKAHLRVDVDDDNDYITALIEAATTAAENNCDCFFRACDFTFTRHGFPPGRCPIAVPGGNVADISEITYTTVAGVSHSMGSGWILDSSVSPCQIYATDNTVWPLTHWERKTVTVLATAVDSTNYINIGPVKQAILLYIGFLYENREAVNVGSNTSELPLGFKDLLMPYKCGDEFHNYQECCGHDYNSMGS